MKEHTIFYIDGQWVFPSGIESFEVVNPCNNEEIIARDAMRKV